MNSKEVDFILKNEKHYRNIVNCFLLEKKNNNFDGVQNNSFGNSNERFLINKFENEEYIKAVNVIKAIEKMQENLTEREKFIYNLKYKQMETIERIAFKLHYSSSLIKKDLKKIRFKFKYGLQNHYKVLN